MDDRATLVLAALMELAGFAAFGYIIWRLL